MKPETWVALNAAIIGTSAFLLNLKTWFDSGVKLELSLVGAAVLVLLAVAAPPPPSPTAGKTFTRPCWSRGTAGQRRPGSCPCPVTRARRDRTRPPSRLES
jgi:hypothetical protein